MKRLAVITLMFLLLVCAAARAGTDGVLSGYVCDRAGLPIADATVLVNAPSDSRSTRTDNSGHFAIIGLTPDAYTVSVAKPGFWPMSQSNVRVEADREQTVRIVLPRELVVVAIDHFGYYAWRPWTIPDAYYVRTSDRSPESTFQQFWRLLFFVPGVTPGPGGATLR